MVHRRAKPPRQPRYDLILFWTIFCAADTPPKGGNFNVESAKQTILLSKNFDEECA